MGKIELLPDAAKPPLAAERLFVEVLDRHDEVLERVVLERLPARIGRAYTNEVIVDDAYLAAQHAEIRRDAAGGLEIVDLGTRNRLRAPHSRVAIDRIELVDEAQFHAGRTSFRVRTQAYAVAPERPERGREERRALAPFALAFAVLLVVSTGLALVRTAEPIESSRILSEVIKTVLATLTYASLWSIVNWLAARRWRFVAHATLASLAALVAIALELPVEWLAFAFSSTTLWTLANYVWAPAIAWIVFRHLRLLERMRPRIAALVASLLVGAIVGIESLDGHASAAGNVSRLSYIDTLLPPELRVAPAHPAQVLFERIERIAPVLEVERAAR